MRIVKELPPNYEQIVQIFPAVLANPGVVFCYGDTIYTLSSGDLPQAILAHEKVHSDRQLEYQGGPDRWWQQYLEDQVFRFEEELLAHTVELDVLSLGVSRNQRRLNLRHVSEKLSSPIYGPMCNEAFAKSQIKLLSKEIKK